MAIIGKLLKNGIKIREALEQDFSTPIELQKNELKKLMITARDTSLGRHYQFSSILKSFRSSSHDTFYDDFKAAVPVHDYQSMNADWWQEARDGKADVSWPGKVNYFALSSGTSDASSKYIPITTEMLRSIKKTSVRQILTLSKYDVPDELYTKGILMLGGSTNLRQNGRYFEGDLSGITASQIPFWFQHHYKPGKKIARTTNWAEKLDEITKMAPTWDIGIIVGVPAWLQLLLEKIVTHYKVDSIHDIWPNLSLFVHGGVSFEPYKRSFSKYLGRPLIYMETYLASEGFLAFQDAPDSRHMKLVLNNGIFYEFVPFNDQNFDTNGDMRSGAEVLKIDEVHNNQEYALLITTNAGAWRYLIGDTVRIIAKQTAEIVITGRTKHFLSLCGEHLSLDNMNKAVEIAAEQLNIHITEFAVAGYSHGPTFAHHWFVGTNDHVDEGELGRCIDDIVKGLNDDYATERAHALSEMSVKVLPTDMFYDWMRMHGKEGGQNKFPRVLKKEKLSSWEAFLNNSLATA
ncbi:MAG: GH3 auxin-responsive promoter family protein [Cyclobacteriaceae bacterium]